MVIKLQSYVRWKSETAPEGERVVEGAGAQGGERQQVLRTVNYIHSYFLTPAGANFLAQQSGTTCRTGWCEIMSQRGLVQRFILLGPKLRHGTSYICTKANLLQLHA